jgi:BirA family transcriptional regulator, biotin operon repressor / biotin---[acetyl-CoA-carboxylase] ligase
MSAARFLLLRMLADGEIHSAERIRRALGLSEIDLDKLVSELEMLGLRVLGAGGPGYRLEERLDLYDARLVVEGVMRESPGLSVEILDECPSTNTALVERAKAGAAHGTVLVCEHQSAGRGRRGNSWVSAVGGGVTFSVLWRFSCGAGALAGLSLAAAVSAAEALERLGVRHVEVKWPNDLYCEGGKLGGILIETSGEAAGSSAAVIGIGVNMRLGASERERVGRPVTDIATCSAAVPSRTAVLGALLASIAAALDRFSREGFAPFRTAWLERHAWQGKRVILSQAERAVAEGEVVGIAEDGALVLASERGIQRFHSGELSLRLEPSLE